MDIREAQAKVREFHVKHGFATDLLKRKVTPGQEQKFELRWFKTGLRRAQLFSEEGMAEFTEAWANMDVVKMADALGDTLFIVLGSAVAAGIDVEPVLEEIIRSNMTKDVRAKDDFRLRDKGKSYEPPDLEGILMDQKLL